MMKQTIKTLAAISFAILAMTSCSEDKEPEGRVTPVINLSTYELRFTLPVDSTIVVDVESNVDWVAIKEGDGEANWLTITPENGKGGIDPTSMKVNVQENTTTSQRAAIIRVSSVRGGATKELIVTQYPKLGKLGQDSLILANFYNEREGWSWGAPWVLEDPISTWPKVTVTISEGELRVTAIDFQYQGDLGGPIPDEFQHLDALTYLQFFRSGLNCELPAWLPKMTKLTEFSAAECGLQGQIPESYWDMTQLQHLRLENNGIKGPLSEKIGQLVNLKEIKLHGNTLGGQIPGTIGKMSSLLDIDLYQCGFEGELPAGIGQGTQIQNIRFDGNPKLTGPVPEEWGGITDMLILHVGGTKINKLASSMSACKKLWELDIHDCSEIKEIPESWIDNGLEYIRAEYSGLESLPAWPSHENLVSINVTGCRIEGPIPEFTGTVSHAFYSGNRFSGGLPQSVINTKRLQNLYLDNCTYVQGEVDPKIWLSESITSLDFSYTKLSGVLPTDAQYRNKMLAFQYINIENCEFSGPLPEGFFLSSPSLQTARLKNNNFSGNLPLEAGNKLNLATLSLSGNRFQGVIPTSYIEHEGWSSVNMWNPAENICPQQDSYGFTGDACDKFTAR